VLEHYRRLANEWAGVKGARLPRIFAHYLDEFVAKTDPDELASILAKIWNKMSPRRPQAALRSPQRPTTASR
jgi:hypothetical protein